MYDYLETNADSHSMAFSQEPIPDVRTGVSMQKYGPDTPFRPHYTVRKWIESMLERNGYQDLVEYNTTVERVDWFQASHEWKVTLRKQGLMKHFEILT